MNEIQEPAELAVRAASSAAEDAGNPGLLARLEMVCVANILSWGYADPVSCVAGRIGADPRTRWVTGVGACAPQWFVGQVADRIAVGELRLALIGGAALVFRRCDVTPVRLIAPPSRALRLSAPAGRMPRHPGSRKTKSLTWRKGSKRIERE